MNFNYSGTLKRTYPAALLKAISLYREERSTFIVACRGKLIAIVRFFKLALGGGASDMSRDTPCATCHELVFLKSYLTSLQMLHVFFSISKLF